MSASVPKSEAITEWFPLGISLDLVRAPVQCVRDAVADELRRFLKPEELEVHERLFDSLGSLFASVAAFANVPTEFFVIPTCTVWTVLWNNSFMCNGYDSLCYCLTTNHGLTTLHWASSDIDAVFLAGTQFTFRTQTSHGLRERVVYCAAEDRKWVFHQAGEPLPEEDVEWYSSRRKRDRLNEFRLMTLLGRLGAFPWQDRFYDFARPVVHFMRTDYPPTVTVRGFEYVRKRAAASDA